MFVFCVCQVGAEGALKKEISRNHPELRFAYSRPGFLTFKRAGSEEFPPDFALSSIFARSYGLSVGKAEVPEAVFDRARELWGSGRKGRLHVFERDLAPPGEEPKDSVPGQISTETLERLQRSPEFKNLFLDGAAASPGDHVMDLIYLEPGSWWIGHHVQSPKHSPYPGGKPPILLPSEAPSRAYLKLEEAILWSGAPLKAKDTAVEIGSAPGGATFALLERGLEVIGIDPGEMAESVFQFGPNRFRHLAKPAAQVRQQELGPAVQWILLDMNVAPVISLNTVERIAPWFPDSLLGLILTLKLNEWKFAEEIPKLLRRVERLGMARIRARQLAYNKQEICVVALSRKGLARRARS